MSDTQILSLHDYDACNLHGSRIYVPTPQKQICVAEPGSRGLSEVLTAIGAFTGAMDGTALIEMLRSMSQAGYSSSASLGNGPVAPHQQQHEEPMSDAMMPPGAHMAPQPASMAPAQPDAPAAEAPAEGQPTEAEPGQHADQALATRMDIDAVALAASNVEPELRTADDGQPADMNVLPGPQMSEPEQPAEALSAVPPQQASEASQPPQQQAVDAPTMPERAAPSQLVPEAETPAEQPDSAAPLVGLKQQPGVPDGATERAIDLDAVQLAENAVLAQPGAVPAETPGNANGMQDGQDTIMHDAEEAAACQIQAAVAEPPAMAEPAKPAAANHVEAGVSLAAEHGVSHGSSDVHQAASMQQATSGSAAGAVPGANSHQALAESLEEKVLTAQDGSATKLESDVPVQSTAVAKPAIIAQSGPDMLDSIADVSGKPVQVAAAADHDDLGTVSTAEPICQKADAAMAVDDNGEHQTLAKHTTQSEADPGNSAVQAPEVHVSKDGVPKLSMIQEDERVADDSSAAAAGGEGRMSSMQPADGQM